MKFPLPQSRFNFAFFFFPLGVAWSFCFFFSCRSSWWALSVPSPSTPTLHCDLGSQGEQFPISFVHAGSCSNGPLQCTVADFSCSCFLWSKLPTVPCKVCHWWFVDFSNMCNNCWVLTRVSPALHCLFSSFILMKSSSFFHCSNSWLHIYVLSRDKYLGLPRVVVTK